MSSFSATNVVYFLFGDSSRIHKTTKMKFSHLLTLCLAVCIFSACNRNKPLPAIPEKKSTFQKMTFTQLQLKSTITLISETECEVSNGGNILLAEYSREENKLRIVIRTGNSPTVKYYEITPEGLRDPQSGVVFLASGSLLTAQEDKERSEHQRAKNLQSTITAMLALLDEDKREQVLDRYYDPDDAKKAKADGTWTKIVAIFENNRATFRAEWQTVLDALSKSDHAPGADIEHGVVFADLTIFVWIREGDNWVFNLKGVDR